MHGQQNKKKNMGRALSATENRKASGLCPTQKLNSGSAEPGRLVGETGTMPLVGLQTLQHREYCEGGFLYLFVYFDISNAGILITIFTQLFSEPYL